MASNVDLIKQANELAEQLGTTCETEGLNNAALVSLVGNLRTGVAAADAEAKAAADADAETGANPDGAAADAVRAREDAIDARVAKAAEVAAEDPPPFAVAPGTSITKMGGGIIGPGDEITAANLSGGQKAIDDFVKAGKIVKG